MAVQTELNKMISIVLYAPHPAEVAKLTEKKKQQFAAY